MIALSVKHTITPHIHSTKSAKQTWDIMAGLYASRNKATIALLRKELESKIMNEEDDMDTFLAGVNGINEQVIFVGEVISNSSLVQTILDALPDSYQTFASTKEILKLSSLMRSAHCCCKRPFLEKTSLDNVQLNRLLLLLKEEVATVMQPLLMVLLRMENHMFLMLLLATVHPKILVIRAKRRCAAITVKLMIT
ncbi:hypothetical protein L7F22_028172 [Adiantum nelumboides]|nr:hypothetical protein [Adiantum nelumboides]